MPIYSPDSTQRKLDLQDLFGGAAILDLARDNGVPGKTPADVVRAAALDPAAAGDFLTGLADRIAVGLAAVIAVLDPYLVVLAGPIAQAGGEMLLAAVTAAARRVAPLEGSIAVTTIDDDAVLLGTLDAGLIAVHEALIASIRDN
jgi:predicted NBD/HSP70 family sugar kinase